MSPLSHLRFELSIFPYIHTIHATLSVPEQPCRLSYGYCSADVQIILILLHDASNTRKEKLEMQILPKKNKVHVNSCWPMQISLVDRDLKTLKNGVDYGQML